MLRRARWIIKKRRRNFCDRASGRRGRRGGRRGRGAGAKHGNANDHGRPPSRMIMPNYLPRTSAAKLSFLPAPRSQLLLKYKWRNANTTMRHIDLTCASAFFTLTYKVKLVSFSLFHLWVGGGEKRAALIQLTRFIRETLDGSAERVSRRAAEKFFQNFANYDKFSSSNFSCLLAQDASEQRKWVEMVWRR